MAVNCILNVLNALRKPAVTAALVLGLLLFMRCYPISAIAATGGRMGGSCSSSSSSRSSSSSSSRSKWSSSSYSRSSYSYYYSSGRSYSFSLELSDEGRIIIIIFLICTLLLYVACVTASERRDVLMLQLGLLGSKKSIQRELNQISETADTSTAEGLHYILTETALVLLRHSDYCISTYSSVDVTWSMEEGEKRFNQVSIKERAKFDEETLVNVNSIRKQSSTIPNTTEPSNEYLVITILVTAKGEQKLPTINNSEDLKEALQNLASVPLSRTLAVEVLWTPQDEKDTLSEQEFLEDYPSLRPLV